MKPRIPQISRRQAMARQVNMDGPHSLKLSREGNEGDEGRLLLEPLFPSHPSRDSSEKFPTPLRFWSQLQQLPPSVSIRASVVNYFPLNRSGQIDKISNLSALPVRQAQGLEQSRKAAQGYVQSLP